MSKPSINPDKFQLKEESVLCTEKAVVALKGNLLYCLDMFLMSKREILNQSSVTNSTKAQLHSKSASVTLTKSFSSGGFIDWKKIPLKQKVLDTSLIYVSALPQMLRGSYDFSSAKSLRLQTQKLAEELNQFQLQIISPRQAQSDTVFNFLSMLWNEFVVEAERSGWLTFKLSNRGLWYWLEQFQINAHSTKPKHTLFISQLFPVEINTTCSQQKKPSSVCRCSTSHTPAASEKLFCTENSCTKKSRTEKSRSTPSAYTTGKRSEVAASDLLWRVQYSFACCCSLIRQSRARFQFVPEETVVDSVESANTSSTLMPSPPTSSTSLPLALWALIPEIVATIDATYDEKYLLSRKRQHRDFRSVPFLLKQSAQLSQALDVFYRDIFYQIDKYEYIDETVIKLLVATKETLGIVLHQCEASASESL